MSLLRFIRDVLAQAVGTTFFMLVWMPLWLSVVFAPFAAVAWVVRTYRPAERAPGWAVGAVTVFLGLLPYLLLDRWVRGAGTEQKDPFWDAYEKAKGDPRP